MEKLLRLPSKQAPAKYAGVCVQPRPGLYCAAFSVACHRGVFSGQIKTTANEIELKRKVISVLLKLIAELSVCSRWHMTCCVW